MHSERVPNRRRVRNLFASMQQSIGILLAGICRRQESRIKVQSQLDY